jgi:hypothetical protein
MPKPSTVTAILAAFIALPILACGGCLMLAFVLKPDAETVKAMQDAQAAREKSQPTQPPPAPVTGITMDKYYAIRTGMTRAQVNSLMGKSGEELSRTEIAGSVSEMVSWKNWTGSNVTVLFTDGKVMSKAQLGL